MILLAFDILFAYISTLFFPNLISDKSVLFSNSYFSILVFAFILFILRYERKLPKDKRREIYTHLLGLLFSFWTACGYSLDVYGEIRFLHILLCILLFAHVLGAGISILWDLLQKADLFLSSEVKSAALLKIDGFFRFLTSHPLVLTTIFFLCYIPLFIADFPGGFIYDATGELMQTSYGYNGNYPMLHSAIITYLLPITHRLFNSYNVGIAIYVICQMLLLSYVYSSLICTFYKQGANCIVVAVAAIYCGLFPVIQIFAVQEVRDILFSILLLYALLLFYTLQTNTSDFLKSVFEPIRLGLVFVLALLARNNNAGTIALLVVIVVSVALWFCYRKINIRGASLLSGSMILGYIIISLLLSLLCQPVRTTEKTGSLSLVSQSLARAYLYENKSWSDSEIEELSRYMDIEDITYCSEDADVTKIKIKKGVELKTIMPFWLKVGVKHPGCYFDAIMANSQNMWFPNSVVDGYKQFHTEPGLTYYDYDKCYFYITDTLEPPAEHRNLLPGVLNFYTRIGLYLSFEKIPVVSMMFSIGFNIWILLNCLCYALYRKKSKLYLTLFILLGYVIVTSFVPIVLLRYFAALFLAMPIIILFTLQPSVSDPMDN